MNISNMWLLVGRETEGNNIKNYILMDYNGCTQFVQKRSIAKFCKEHDVINVQVCGGNITGKGIAITALPRYVKQQEFGLQQVSGMSQAEVIQMAQPLINQYMQKKEDAQKRKETNSPEAQKSKQSEYVIKKLIAIEDLITIALAMKDITNELASSEHITRYIKQIDIDNADGDSLDNIIRRQGVTGLANGLSNRLDKIKERVHKQSLDKTFISQADKLKAKCDELKRLHSETKDIIKSNRGIEKEQGKLLNKQLTEVDSIPIVDDVSDMISVEAYDSSADISEIPVVEDVESDSISVEQCENYDISAIEDIFNKPEETTEEKQLKEKINKLCSTYSTAITTMGNIIHNPKRVAEIAHALDMEYPGVHNRITKDKINSHYNSEEEVIQAISEHYDYITKEDNSSNIWKSLLHNHLGKSGNEIYRLVFTRDVDIDDTNLNKHQELFDFYIQTLIDKIVAQLNTDKEQCIQKALQNFTKISSSKREQMLSEIFEDSWYRAGNSLEEYGSSGWGGWTADDERKKAKRKTLKQYANLSDEEFIEKLTKDKEDKLLWKCREILPSLYVVDSAEKLTANNIINQHEIVIETAVDKIIKSSSSIGIQRDAFNNLKNHPEDRSILVAEAVRCFNDYNGKYNNEAFGVGILELDELICKYREYNMNYCINLLSNVQTFINNINASMIVLKNGRIPKLNKEYYYSSIVLLAKVYYVAKLCGFNDLSTRAYELEKLLNHTVFEVGKTMEQ